MGLTSFAPVAKAKSARPNDSPTNACMSAGDARSYLRTIAAHSAARLGISFTSDIGFGGPTFIPSESATVGHTSGHWKTSPLVMLKCSLRHAGVVAAHSID